MVPKNNMAFNEPGKNTIMRDIRR